MLLKRIYSIVFAVTICICSMCNISLAGDYNSQAKADFQSSSPKEIDPNQENQKEKVSQVIKNTIQSGKKVPSKSKTLYNSVGEPKFKVEVYESQKTKLLPVTDLLRSDRNETIFEKTEAFIITRVLPPKYKTDETDSIKAYSTINYAYGTTSRGDAGYRLISANGGWINLDNDMAAKNYTATIMNRDNFNSGLEWNVSISNEAWNKTCPSSYVVSTIPADNGACGAISTCRVYEIMYPSDTWSLTLKNLIIDSNPY